MNKGKKGCSSGVCNVPSEHRESSGSWLFSCRRGLIALENYVKEKWRAGQKLKNFEVMSILTSSFVVSPKTPGIDSDFIHTSVLSMLCNTSVKGK